MAGIRAGVAGRSWSPARSGGLGCRRPRVGRPSRGRTGNPHGELPGVPGGGATHLAGRRPRGRPDGVCPVRPAHGLPGPPGRPGLVPHPSRRAHRRTARRADRRGPGRTPGDGGGHRSRRGHRARRRVPRRQHRDRGPGRRCPRHGGAHPADRVPRPPDPGLRDPRAGRRNGPTCPTPARPPPRAPRQPSPATRWRRPHPAPGCPPRTTAGRGPRAPRRWRSLPTGHLHRPGFDTCTAPSQSAMNAWRASSPTGRSASTSAAAAGPAPSPT